ncbi:propionate--CoA ligase [Sphingomonas sp. Root710]|uniref:AMP-binding protein n=1 Tax=Sphingomonas sp. Root710 TaxID=1736594 RepID=UPI0006FDED47|nr:AMP-binding protein [Sphingomonas sp. Root710]KRB84987.1 propionate--CoA ligase [Sphingomonas sp. Root710]
MSGFETGSYAEVYRRSIDQPEEFWMEAARAVDWTVTPTRTADAEPDGTWHWFPDGRLNSCYNAVDRHVAAGRGAQIALIHDSAMTGAVQRFSYAHLLDEVARVAGMMASHGVGVGDRVLIYMPMVPEAVFAMLACARLGAVHSVVFGGFAAAELAKRIDDAAPVLVMAASCGLEPGRVVAYKPLLDEAISLATHKPRHCIVLQRPQCHAALKPGRDLDWAEQLAGAPAVGCVAVASGDPLYILYTSGTTGIPKGVVHDNGGHAVALTWSLPAIYGVHPGETFWAASDIGWAVGHSYIVYGPLFCGCTTVMYEGKPVGTPDAGAFWRVVRDHGVSVLFTAPTAIRAVKRDDPAGSHVARDGIGGLRALFLAGERADPDTLSWAEHILGVPVIDHWWQTELGWPALATCLGLGDRTIRHGSAGRPVPGNRFEVLGPDSQPVQVGEAGDIVIRLPLAPGALTTLWQRPDHFRSSYLEAHQGYYTTGDAGIIDADGYVHVMGRIDDIINVAGHRLSTGGIEQIIAAHPDVAECAVVGAADALKGMVPVGLAVLKSGVDRPDDLICREIVERVRNELGPVAAFKSVTVTQQLPKTRSGKVLRAMIRRIADGEDVTLPATIDDPKAMAAVRSALAKIGYGIAATQVQ